MSTDDPPPRRGVWSKYAWKTIRAAMKNTGDTVRLSVIVCVIVTTTVIMPAISFLIVRVAI